MFQFFSTIIHVRMYKEIGVSSKFYLDFHLCWIGSSTYIRDKINL